MKKSIVGVATLLVSLLVVLIIQGQGSPVSANIITYDQPGTYGPDTGIDVIDGDLVVQSANIKLQNLQITGNLYLTGQIQGPVELKNVSVEKVLTINSSGEAEITLHNSTIYSLAISSAAGKVSVSNLSSTVETVTFLSRTHVVLSGTYTHLSDKVGAYLYLDNATVYSFEVQEDAVGANITLPANSHIAQLTLSAATNVHGQGTIARADILAENCWLEIEPAVLNKADGILLAQSPSINNGEPELTAADNDEEEVDKSTFAPVILYAMDSFNLRPGEEASQLISASPAQVELTVSSNNEQVATVEVDGMRVTVKAHSPGTARILVAGSHEEHNDASAPFTVTVAAPSASAPTASPRSGQVEPGTVITLSTGTSNATIYYTTDGSTPTTSSSRYSSGNRPVVGQNGLTLRAIAVRESYVTSSVSTFQYTANVREQAPPPPDEPEDEEEPALEDPLEGDEEDDND